MELHQPHCTHSPGTPQRASPRRPPDKWLRLVCEILLWVCCGDRSRTHKGTHTGPCSPKVMRKWCQQTRTVPSNTGPLQFSAAVRVRVYVYRCVCMCVLPCVNVCARACPVNASVCESIWGVCVLCTVCVCTRGCVYVLSCECVCVHACASVVCVHGCACSCVCLRVY